jgi:predicted transposase YbfD/YdcC
VTGWPRPIQRLEPGSCQQPQAAEVADPNTHAAAHSAAVAVLSLLEPLDLTGAVITADAIHIQREHARFLVSGNKAHYILVVKKNQSSLYAQVTNLPWRHIPAGHRQRGRGHGREEHRTLQAATVAAGLDFPHAVQAIRLTRRIRSSPARRNGRPSPSTPSPA